MKRWEEAQTDHGYNATPVWTILGTTLANLAPASDTQIDLLSLLDPAYAFGMVGLIWWAFGWRTLAVALCVFATNFPSRFYWTGGAYLRWDWLFYLAGGVALRSQGEVLRGRRVPRRTRRCCGFSRSSSSSARSWCWCRSI